MKILLVEDDVAVASSIVDGLAATGHQVTSCLTGSDALRNYSENSFDLMLLDLGLPDMDGQDVIKAIRAQNDLPIIIVSARDEEIDRVLALELGADDYLVKPFGMRELSARIKAVTRRGNIGTSEKSELQKIKDLKIDHRSQKIFLGEKEVTLTAKEFELLVFLAQDPGAVFRREDILKNVWDMNWYGSTKTLDAHVASIRKKLKDPNWIESVRGVGFRLGYQN